MAGIPGSYQGWIGRYAYAREGEEVGQINAIYLDLLTGRPEWVSVANGPGDIFVPFAGTTAHVTNGGPAGLRSAYDQATIEGSPEMTPSNGSLTSDEIDDVFAYYGFDIDSPVYGLSQRVDARYSVVPIDGNGDVGARLFVEEPNGDARLQSYLVVDLSLAAVDP